MKNRKQFKEAIERFIEASLGKIHGLSNQYLYFVEGEFYVRTSRTTVTGEDLPCFTLANVTIKTKYREQGVFKAFWQAAAEVCKERGYVLYIENANNPTLDQAMKRWKIEPDKRWLGNNYYIAP